VRFCLGNTPFSASKEGAKGILRYTEKAQKRISYPFLKTTKKKERKDGKKPMRSFLFLSFR
jgi:hypothetical protein